MTADEVVVALTLFGTGAVVCGAGWLIVHVARRAAAGTLRRNEIAGIRTRLTLSSDDAWRAAHVAAEKDTVRAGKGGIVGGALGMACTPLGLAGVSLSTQMVLYVASVLGATVWLLVWTLRATAIGQRAATEVTRRASER